MIFFPPWKHMRTPESVHLYHSIGDALFSTPHLTHRSWLSRKKQCVLDCAAKCTSPVTHPLTSTTSATTRCAVACHTASCERSEVKERELIRAAFIRDLQTCEPRQPEDSPFRHVFKGMNHSRASFSTKSALSRAWDIPQLWERRTGQSFQSASVRSRDCWPVLGGVEMSSFLLNLVRVYVTCHVPFWCDVFLGAVVQNVERLP